MKEGRMFVLDAVDARKGDALIIRWGTADQPRTMLVDGGPSPTWTKRLKPRLEQIAGFDPLDGQLPTHLDLVVVSHVDDDHIQGILDLTNEIIQANATGRRPSVTMKELWHNAFTDHAALSELEDEPVLGDPAVPPLVEELAIHADPNAPDSSALKACAQSVTQGRKLANIAGSLRVPRNARFAAHNGFVRAGAAPIDLERMTIEILAPNDELIAKLKSEWTKKLTAILRREADQQRAAAQAIAATVVDDRAPNLSSIVLLAKFAEKTMLLTGDARGDHILSAIDRLRPSPDEPLHVDLFKVPHHGSARSNDRRLFDTVVADHYVISGNGEHGNPHPDVLMDLFESQAGRPFTLHLTNRPGAGAVNADDVSKASEAQHLLDDAAQTHPNVTIAYRAENAKSVTVTLDES